MEIKITCPVCNAQNKLTTHLLNCRRCKEDLSLLYHIKAYSYKKRLESAMHLLNGDHDNSMRLLARARFLDKT